ncbi:aspartic proteinase nepenthesin-1-like [Silene latifolia]|uniref:aspartic proteinase nepenthesin-1-like n=1 Tax=Silene latifolia TaxID=37657 RepID=UPI003D777650
MLNARKLTANNANFSVDLIRRNSSKISLSGGQGRPSFGSISNNHQITLSSKFYDISNVQSALIPDGGEFNMKISIGTPPVEFTAIADTGSDLIWVQCSPCQRCIGNQSHLFDPTQSSTDNIIACTSQFCDANQFGLSQASCSQNDSSCIYAYGYGDGSNSTGVLSTDTVTFVSTSIPNVTFGCGYNQEGFLDPLGDGIVGLGGVVSIPFDNQDTPAKHYYVSLDSISIGNTSVPVTNTTILDSGTTLTYLPSDVYEGINSAVKASIGLTPINNSGLVYDPCYEIDSLDELNFPGMVFHFSGGDVVLNAENSFFPDNGLSCFAMVATDTPPYIFGNIAQTNFHIGYDLQAQQVSFAPADCTTF